MASTPTPLVPVNGVAAGAARQNSASGRKRWKKTLDEIRGWDRFNRDNYMTLDEIDDWVRNTRPKVMYKVESNID